MTDEPPVHTIIPSIQSIPESSWNSSQGSDPVFSTSATVPQLRCRQHVLIQRVHSAPTLMEHEVGLELRSISDDFNDSYNQVRADRTRRASHPETNNHHPHGFIDSLRRQFSRRSRTSSHGDDYENASGPDDVPVMQPGSSRLSQGSSRLSQGSSRLSQRVSVQSVPEEDEEAAEVNCEAAE